MTASLYKRMVLLPENEYALLKQSGPPTEGAWPSDTSVEREQKLYALSLRQNREPYSSNHEPVAANNGPSFEDEINHFPKAFQSRAKRLLMILERHHPFISWTKDGEVSFSPHGSPFSGSSLTDLLYHATAVKRRNFQPTAWPEFLETLKQLNVPSTALSTITAREIRGEEVAQKPSPMPPPPPPPLLTKKRKTAPRVRVTRKRRIPSWSESEWETVK